MLAELTQAKDVRNYANSLLNTGKRVNHSNLYSSVIFLWNFRNTQIYSILVFYRRKKSFKVSAGLQSALYDYRDSDRNKKRHYAVLSGEKSFQEGDLLLSLHLKYRYTDYDEQNNDHKSSVRVEGRYRF